MAYIKDWEIKMADRYDPVSIEKKWADKWEKRGDHAVDLRSAQKPFFNLMMFPYPSAEGLHVGNCFAFIGTDIFGRYKKLQGFDLFEPMGFDAFGIHSENFALKKGIHPKALTEKNINNFKENQLKRLGNHYDWAHSVDTTRPEYYRWTQWIFLQLYKNGLCEQKEAPVNWCPECKTVLADSQVNDDGTCERHSDVKVEQRNLRQWFFKITKYAERLLSNLYHIDWPEDVKQVQRNKIGRSLGATVTFHLEDGTPFEIFTTRPDTLWGVTYMVFAPEHELVDKITTAAQSGLVNDYQNQTRRKSSFERSELSTEKTGVFTGSYAINPATGEKVPIYIADYVLMGYGTGAIMAVPAHDQRDFEFAQKFGLPIREVIAPDGVAQGIGEAAFHGEGVLINSGEFSGTPSKEALEKVTAWLEKAGKGKGSINYRLRDWCVSRQRYWGPPIPIIYCEKCGTVTVPEKDLPVMLPESDDYIPDGSGRSPLARNTAWSQTTCPQCGGPAVRDTDVTDNFLDSAWYFMRYPSTECHSAFIDKQISDRWLPVDNYIGGREHSFGHLLYFRFINMVLHDLGYLREDEPVKRFRAHGIITKDGAKMSKSKGNIVNPDEIINKFGSDTFRLYLMFLGPYTLGGDWRDDGIMGCRRFVERVWDYVSQGTNDVMPPECERSMHRSIKKVTEDMEILQYNTAIAQLMTYMNDLRQFDARHPELVKTLLVLLAPLAPFVTEELWEQLGGKGSIFKETWPVADPEKMIEDSVTVVIQINGKLRSEIKVARDTPQAELEKLALADERAQRYFEGQVRKVIVVPNKLVNIVCK